MPRIKELSDDLKQKLQAITEHFDLEDKPVRERQIMQWRKLKLYWAGYQRIWYDIVAHDWRTWDEWQALGNDDQNFYDKPINVLRAYVESIIAAMSITIPQVSCGPKDADNADDLLTAKAGNNVSKIIAKDNDDALLWLYLIFVYCTEGLVTCYHYSKEDEKYGTYKVPNEKLVKEEHYICPNPECAEIIPDEEVESPVIEGELGNPTKVCLACGQSYVPEALKKAEVQVPRIDGETTKNKSHQCLEIRGGLYVKVPLYAKVQGDCPYLRYSYETHFSNVLAEFPQLANKFKKDGKIRHSSNAGDGNYERWGRLPIPYLSDFPNYSPTVTKYWLRPSSYNVLCDDTEGIKELTRLFPTGVRVTFINDYLAEAVEEKLDDRWTIAYNPFADYIHHDPIALLLTSMQDILNDLNSLTLQTVEQGIPQTFVDPAVVDLDAYKQSEAAPGSVYGTKAVSATKSIAEGFHTLKTATLGTEVLPYGQKVQEMGQLSSGALPSLFGGSGPQGSRTASEYAMSRSQASQRLQSPWKILTFFYKNIYAKAIPAFIEDMVDDEKMVQRKDDGSFMNLIVRKAETNGKIGEVFLDVSDNLPVSWQQKKETLVELLQLQSPILAQALMAPENLPLLREAFGLNELMLPGEEDRNKQYEEIKLLLDGEPLDETMPSVPVDQLLDNHQIEAEILRNWLVSPEGRDAKINNPSGYMNCLLHYKWHMLYLQQAMMAQQATMMAQEGSNADGTSESKNKNKKESAPIGEESETQLPIQ
jgi:hypothetical protein